MFVSFRSIKLLEVSHLDSEGGRDQQHETFCCDAVKVPLTSDTFDATLCIGIHLPFLRAFTLSSFIFNLIF